MEFVGTDEQRIALQKALVEAQSKVNNLVPTGQGTVGGGRQYQYVTLGDLLEHVRPVLATCGLAIVMAPTDGGLVSQVLHAEGGSLVIRTPWPEPGPTSPQVLGSLTTYLRRYVLSALLGIAADIDDDAAQAEEVARKATDARPPQARPPQARPSDPVAEDRRKELLSRLWKAMERAGANPRDPGHRQALTAAALAAPAPISSMDLGKLELLVDWAEEHTDWLGKAHQSSIFDEEA